jgi:hypothetical protein
VLNGDNGNDTAASVRREVKADGHHVGLKGGRDICVDCWIEGAR